MMHFEDRVRFRVPLLGAASRRGGRYAALLSSHAALELKRALAPTTSSLQDSLIGLAAHLVLFATRGDQDYIYEPQGDPEDFFSTLPEEIRITLPYLQISQGMAELSLGLFIPRLAGHIAWLTAQRVYLLCEAIYHQPLETLA